MSCPPSTVFPRWWYWVLILVPDPDKPSKSRQLMNFRSTKETKQFVSAVTGGAGSGMHKDGMAVS